MSSLISLFLKFVYTGFLAFGGGLATIPILYQLLCETNIITETDFYNMVAISQATPGPFGLNIATYAGYLDSKVCGAIVASLGITLSSVICVSLLARVFEKIKDNKYTIRIMKGVRAAITGVIVIAVLKLFKNALINIPSDYIYDENIWHTYLMYLKNIDIKALIITIAFYLVIVKTRKSPALYILAGAIVGAILF